MSAASTWVFLVMARSYEDSYVESVWTTREAAEKHASGLRPEPPDNFQYDVEARELQS